MHRTTIAFILLSAFLFSASPAHADTAFKPLWTANHTSWNHDVSLAPWGDVASVRQGGVAIFARDTGKRLATFKACYGTSRDRLHFIAEELAALICDDGIEVLTFPTGKRQKPVVWDNKPTASASAAGWIAVGFKSGLVTLYATGSKTGWTPMFTADFKTPITALALSQDGRKVAVGAEREGVVIWSPENNHLHPLHTTKGRTTALTFSPGGGRLFAGVGGFKAMFWNLKRNRLVHTVKTGSWLTLAKFMPDGRVATTGSDGLVLYNTKTTQGLRLGNSGQGLDVSTDGNLICGGDTSGNIQCHATTPQVAGGWTNLPTPIVTASPPSVHTASTPSHVTYTPKSSNNSIEGPPPPDPFWANMALIGWSGTALLGGPISILLIADDVSPDQAALLSATNTAGVISMGIGGVGIAFGAVALLFSPFVALIDMETAGEWALAGSISLLAGIGLVALAPVIFAWGTFETESHFGQTPDNLIALSLSSSVAAALGGIAAINIVEMFEADDWLKVVAVASTSIFMANLTYATFRRVNESTSEEPAMMMAPLIRF